MKKRMIMLMILFLPLLRICSNDEETILAKENSKSLYGTSGVVRSFSESISNGLKNLNNEEAFLEGFSTDNVNIRKEASVHSEILDILPFNTRIGYKKYNNEWVEIEYSNQIDNYTVSKTAFVKSEYISNKPCYSIEYQLFHLTSNNGFKSFMDYKAITSRQSLQYLMQMQYAHTGTYGIRMIGNRYCVAIGTAFNAKVGTYFDLILENGAVIPCIVADIKSNSDTEENNIITRSNGCVSEFIVDEKSLPYDVLSTGSISYCNPSWNSIVKTIKIYNKNIFMEA